MTILETDRLVLRHQTVDDAEFILGLLNEPSWIEFIGDRGVRTVEAAREYLVTGPIAMYERLGFGFYMVELKETGEPMGICGLVKRDYLDDVDIGFAFMPKYWGAGYAYESAAAVMRYATETLGLTRVVAITTPTNHSSAKLLERLGLRFERMVEVPHDDELVRLFGIDIGHG